MLYLRFHCGSGGIGRRASLRSWWPKGRRGSSPFFRMPFRESSVNIGFSVVSLGFLQTSKLIGRRQKYDRDTKTGVGCRQMVNRKQAAHSGIARHELQGSSIGFGFGVHPAACREENGEAQAHAKGAAFKKGPRFRAGIEGRISVLFRGRGMQRCVAEGRQRFQALAGTGALANNLMRIAGMLAQRSSCKPRAAQRDLSACLPLRLTRFPCAQ
jgi:hypothetical protein